MAYGLKACSCHPLRERVPQNSFLLSCTHFSQQLNTLWKLIYASYGWHSELKNCNSFQWAKIKTWTILILVHFCLHSKTLHPPNSNWNDWIPKNNSDNAFGPDMWTIWILSFSCVGRIRWVFAFFSTYIALSIRSGVKWFSFIGLRLYKKRNYGLHKNYGD